MQLLRIAICFALLAAHLVSVGVCAEKIDYFEEAKVMVSKGEYLVARDYFDLAARETPALNDDIAAIYYDTAVMELANGRFDTAVSMLSSAVFHDKDYALKAGNLLVETSAQIDEEEARGRLIHRAVKWVGKGVVAEATVKWYEKKWGPPKRIALETPGWAVLGKVGEGDVVRYVSVEPIRERNKDMVRILPAAFETPMILHISSSPSNIHFSKHLEAVTAFIWIFPAH